MNNIKTSSSNRFFYHLVVFVTLAAFLNGAIGCTSLVKVPVEEISKSESAKKMKVVILKELIRIF